MNQTSLKSITTVDVYWRPGCPFCMRLEHNLKKSKIKYSKHNIWEDKEAAATVRAVADGNEVVPTVFVGDVAMVNPSIKQLTTVVKDLAPHLLSDT